jgi:carboxymethylenebutenolidase
MAETITLKSQIDGFEFTALHAEPEGPRRGGVIVIQEVFGLDPAVKKDVARWASLGFEVIAPSMFDRQERGFVASHDAEGLQVGLKYAGDNGDDNPISDVQACIDALKDKGPVFMVGYCYGGTITWRAASRTKGLAAASSYYGAGVAASAEMPLSCPVICHFGGKDPYIPAAASEAAVRAAHPDVPVYIYGSSGHGFNNEGPDADPSDVRLARERTLALFESNQAGNAADTPIPLGQISTAPRPMAVRPFPPLQSRRS